MLVPNKFWEVLNGVGGNFSFLLYLKATLRNLDRPKFGAGLSVHVHGLT